MKQNSIAAQNSNTTYACEIANNVSPKKITKFIGVYMAIAQ